MKLLHSFFLCSLLAFVKQPSSCLSPQSEIVTNTLAAIENAHIDLMYTSKWPQRRKIRHKDRKKRRGKLSTERYMEKQMLVRNRTLALLGLGMEKFLPNAVDLLDINPQELPGESPFQKWHNHRKNQTGENPRINDTPISNLPENILKPTQLYTYQDEIKSEIEDEMIAYNQRYKAQDIDDSEVLRLNLVKTLNSLQSILYVMSKNETEYNPCEKWVRCKKQLKQVFMGDLPSCPCKYPSGIFYEDKVWDTRAERNFRWKDASGERLDVFKPGAEYCIRSLVSQGSQSLAAQHCCYDSHRHLLTRGSGAGTPFLISPDVSAQLHYTVDILPWILCKGDHIQQSEASRQPEQLYCQPSQHRVQPTSSSRQTLLMKICITPRSKRL